MARALANQQALPGRHVPPHLPAPAGLRSAQHMLALYLVCLCVLAAAVSPKTVCSCPDNAGTIASCGVWSPVSPGPAPPTAAGHDQSCAAVQTSTYVPQQLNASNDMWVACRSGAATTVNSCCRCAAGPAAGQYSQGYTHACITKAASKARASPASPDHSSCVQERGSTGICAWSHSCGHASPSLWSAPEYLVHDHACIVLSLTC